MEDSTKGFDKLIIDMAKNSDDKLRSILELNCKTQNRNKYSKLLTKRQLECLALVAFGFRNNKIGEILIVSESTVKKTLEEIFRRLKTNSRTNAVTIAFVHGILNIDILNEISERYNVKEKQQKFDPYK